MQKIKAHKSLKCFVAVFLLAVNPVAAQNNSVCDSLLNLLQNEANDGHYLAMDSLYAKIRSQCSDKNSSFRALMILRNQRYADGYRLDEADSLYALAIKINSKPDEEDIQYPFRAGIFGSWIGTNFGNPGYAGGLAFGWHPRRKYKDAGIGFDVAVSYQKLPFIISLVNNQSNNKYTSDGYILKTNGANSLYNLQLALSYNIDPDPVGVGAFIGVEMQSMAGTRIKNYYYEYNYHDSLGQNNAHYLTFNSTEKTNINTNSFIKNTVLCNVQGGFNVLWKVHEKCLFTFSPYGAIGLMKTSLKEVNYSLRINYVGFKVACSLLFQKKKIPRV